MPSRSSLYVRPCLRHALLVVGANGVFVATVLTALWLGRRRGIPDHELLRDPIAVSLGPIHAGLLSNVGVLIWTLGAGACLLAGAVLLFERRTRRPGALFTAVGVLTLALAADDLLMFHETAGLGPEWLGIPEEVILTGYAVAAVAILITFRSLILALRQRWVLAIACGAFAASLGIDLLDRDLMYFTEEDVAKLVGIFNWTVGWSLAAAVAVLRAVRAAPAPTVADEVAS